MFSLRRVAFRALSLPSTSISTSSRSITTIARSTVARPSRQSFILPVQRRFASEDVARSESEAEKPATSNATKPADENEDSTLASAISSTANDVTSRASDAAKTVAQAMDSARGTVAGAAETAAGSAGLGYSRASMQNVPPSTNLYVGNLFFDVTVEDLKTEMERFGTVKDVRIIVDNRGLSKGFGYVDFENVEEATQAQENLNQSIFEGRRMSVQFSQPRGDRGLGSGSNFPEPKNPPSKTLFIGNMSFDMTDQDLNDMFRNVKNVIDVRVAIDRRTGQPRGFAHADFVDVASAEKAMEELTDKEVYGRKLRLDYSLSKSSYGKERREGRDSRDSRGPREGSEGSRY